MGILEGCDGWICVGGGFGDFDKFFKVFLWGIVDTGRLVAFSGNWQCSLVINQSTLRQRMHLPCQPSCRKAVYVKASYLKPPDVPTLKHFLSVVEWLKRQNSLDLSFKSNLCFFHFFSMLMCHSWRFGTIHNYLYIYINTCNFISWACSESINEDR